MMSSALTGIIFLFFAGGCPADGFGAGRCNEEDPAAGVRAGAEATGRALPVAVVAAAASVLAPAVGCADGTEGPGAGWAAVTVLEEAVMADVDAAGAVEADGLGAM